MTTDFEIISWRRKDSLRLALYRVLSILSVGLLPIFCFYFSVYFDIWTGVICDPGFADLVVIKVDGKKIAVQVQQLERTGSNGSPVVAIELDCIRYFALQEEEYKFRKVRDIPRNFIRFLDIDYVSDHAPKEMVEEQSILRTQYGLNLMKIPESTFMEIAIRHMLSPFYLFQYFAASVWFAEDYWLYAILILIITFAAIFVTTRETISNLHSLRLLAGSDSTVQALAAETDRTTFDLLGQLGRDIQLISDRQLLPGRKFKLTENMTLPCDAVLICGKVVMDESMLTGECVPVSKSPIDPSEIEGDKSYVLSVDRLTLKSRKIKNAKLARQSTKRRPTLMTFETNILKQDELKADNDDELENIEEEDLETTFIENTALRPPSLIADNELAIKRSGSVLFGGTRVKACYGDECIAVVYRTGFRSAKGMLVASLLKPKEGFINFVSDALWVLLFMVILSTVMYCAVSIRIVELGATPVSVFYHYLDTITIAVPPALTACLTVATAISIGRLKKLSIFVSDTSRVNFAGVVNAICFDKTGTLTEDKLTFIGYQTPVISSRTGVSMDEWMDFNRDNEQVLPLRCQEIMATCHALSLFGFDDAMTPVGDPLEVELLNASGWELKASSTVPGQLIAFPPTEQFVLDGEVMQNEEYKILKHFEFTPDRLRAASIVQEPSGHLVYLMKGSPEVIIKLCSRPTVPSSIHQTMANLAKRGFRVIAVAYRDLRTKAIDSVHSMTQEECERDHVNGQQHTVFAGLLYLSNDLKAESRRSIRALHRANLHTNMITGDHVFTAIAVAKQCHILSPELPVVPKTSNETSAANSGSTANSQGKSCPQPTHHSPLIIKPASQEDQMLSSISDTQQLVKHVLIVDENDLMKGELCIRDYDTGLLVDIDLNRCATLAAKTVYRTIIKRTRSQSGKPSKVSKSHQERTGCDSDDMTTDTEREHHNTKKEKQIKQQTRPPRAMDNKNNKKKNILKSRQNTHKTSGTAASNSDYTLNPMIHNMETHTPFALSASADEDSSSPSISLNTSKVDISLMSLSHFATGSGNLTSGGNAAMNNNSVHSVGSNVSNSSKGGSIAAAAGHHYHSSQPQQPFSLLHHNRHTQNATVPTNDNMSSPASSQHSLLSLRHVHANNESPIHASVYKFNETAASNMPLHRPLLLQLPKVVHVELAITGRALHLIRQLYSYTLYQKLIRYARVFARMKPHDKREVVETLLETLEYKTHDVSLKYMDENEEDVPPENNFISRMRDLESGFLAQETEKRRGSSPLVSILFPEDGTVSGNREERVDSKDNRGDMMSDDEEEEEEHRVPGIAGTKQDRRRRKASMLTTVLTRSAVVDSSRVRSSSSASASNMLTIQQQQQQQQQQSLHMPQNGSISPIHHVTGAADDHYLGHQGGTTGISAAMMVFPTVPQNSQYEQDLESQDYPALSHPNYHHTSHLPMVHHQHVSPISRSRGHSFSTITTHQSATSLQHPAAGISDGLDRDAGAAQRRKHRGNTAKQSSWPMSDATSYVTSTISHAYEFVTEQLAGKPQEPENLEVLFCGDGANDMIALRAATVGISLCDAETSVAAPITSRQATPYSVVQVLREGRCSLITAYVLILFNIMYGTIQLFMVCILYYFGLIPGNYMYLQQDLCYTLILGLTISYSLPSQSLNNLMPPKRFLSRRFLVQLSLLLFLFIFFQILALILLSMQDFYTPYQAKAAFTETYSYEATTSQAMALGQLMIASIVASLGEPFRLPWQMNPYHLYALSIQALWLLFQIFVQDNFLLQTILEIKPVPVSFGLVIVSLLILNMVSAMWVVSYVEEKIAIMTNQRWFEVCAMKQRQQRLFRRQHEKHRNLQSSYALLPSSAAAAEKEVPSFLHNDSTRGAKYPNNHVKNNKESKSRDQTPNKGKLSLFMSGTNRQKKDNKKTRSNDSVDEDDDSPSKPYDDRKRLLA